MRISSFLTQLPDKARHAFGNKPAAEAPAQQAQRSEKPAHAGRLKNGVRGFMQRFKLQSSHGKKRAPSAPDMQVPPAAALVLTQAHEVLLNAMRENIESLAKLPVKLKPEDIIQSAKDAKNKEKAVDDMSSSLDMAQSANAICRAVHHLLQLEQCMSQEDDLSEKLKTWRGTATRILNTEFSERSGKKAGPLHLRHMKSMSTQDFVQLFRDDANGANVDNLQKALDACLALSRDCKDYLNAGREVVGYETPPSKTRFRTPILSTIDEAAEAGIEQVEENPPGSSSARPKAESKIGASHNLPAEQAKTVPVQSKQHEAKLHHSRANPHGTKAFLEFWRKPKQTSSLRHIEVSPAKRAENEKRSAETRQEVYRRHAAGVLSEAATLSEVRNFLPIEHVLGLIKPVENKDFTAVKETRLKGLKELLKTAGSPFKRITAPLQSLENLAKVTEDAEIHDLTDKAKGILDADCRSGRLTARDSEVPGNGRSRPRYAGREICGWPQTGRI